MAKSGDKAKEKGSPAMDIKDALQAFKDSTNKKYGTGSVFSGDDEIVLDIEAIPSGNYDLDLAIGIGGLPKGRIVEIFGAASGGKTTLALSFAKSVTNSSGYVMYIDAEQALNMGQVKDMGLDLSHFVFSQPEYGEQALDTVIDAVHSGVFDYIVVDSVAALTPKAELEGTMEDNHVGRQARMMSMAMRKIAGIASKKNVCVVFINQIREKVGVMFGSPETTPGGRALPFAASVRLDVRRKDILKSSKSTDPIGVMSLVKVIKNKVGPPFRTAEIDIVFGHNGEYGVSASKSILDMGVEIGLIAKAGSWYTFPDGQRAGSLDDAKTLIVEDRTLFDTLDAACQEEVQRRVKKHTVSIESGDFDAAEAFRIAEETLAANAGSDGYGEGEGDGFISPDEIK